jgi:hypothetical protein
MLSTEREVQSLNTSSDFYSLQSQQSPLGLTNPPLLPPMKLLKQTSSSQERISINGLQKSVHVVVKNAPFMVQIALTNHNFHNQVIDLNEFTFDATLLYDSDGPTEKLVDFVKIKPVDHKPTVNETGDQVSIELRIKVLTSQHENSFFRVKISLLDPNTGMPFQPPLVCYTDPVKVISKPEQVKKKPAASSTNVTATNNVSKKRSVNDLLLETIARIEEQQREHQQMIEKLLHASEMNKAPQMPHIQQQHHLPISPHQFQLYEQQQQQQQQQQFQRMNNHVNGYPDDGSLLYQLPHMKQIFPDNLLSNASIQSPNNIILNTDSPSNSGIPLANCTAEESEFETAFRKFFKLYTKLNEEEKPLKIRKLLRASSQRESEKISEFLDLFQTEGFHKSAPVDTIVHNGNSPCQCPTCPYQSEISQLNEFYDQILTFPPQHIQPFE